MPGTRYKTLVAIAISDVLPKEKRLSAVARIRETNAHAINIILMSIFRVTNTCFRKYPAIVALNTVAIAVKSPPKSLQKEALARDAKN